MAESNSLVLSFQKAREIVEAYKPERESVATERLPLLEAAGRYLATDIVADRDLPPFARSIRDGFAVIAADVSSVPTRLRVAGEMRAGDPICNKPVQRGEAIEIMTGASMPEGTDAVVMIEYTTRDGDHVVIERAAKAGENFVPRGAEAKRGDRLITKGTRIEHRVVAVAASVGASAIEVVAKPKVAILSTGDEIVPVEETPAEHQIRNSNTYSLAAQVAAVGGEPIILPTAADDPQRLRDLMQQGLAADMLVLSGGVSMGKYDFVETVMAEFDARVHFNGALIQPGKPIVFADAQRPGSSHRVPVFGLPGNPVSTMVTFELFAAPVLRTLLGASQVPLRFLQATLASDLRTKTGLTRFLPARLTGSGFGCTVDVVRWQGSGDVVAQSRSDCYLVVEPEREFFKAGEMVPVLIQGTL